MAEGLDRITQRVKNLLSITWDAMSNDERVEDSVLTDPISYAEALYLGKEPDEAEQEDLDRLVIEFLAKVAVIDLIPAAIDYWLEQKTSVVTSGTNETVTYPERIRALEKLRESLIADVAKLEPIVAPLIPIIATRKGASAPRMNTIADELLTPNPKDFGAPYGPKIGT